MDDRDNLFKTLVMPAAFIITIVWTYYFFLGNIVASHNFEVFDKQFVNFYLLPITTHITIFVSSLFLWSASVMARYKETQIKLCRFKTGYQGVARGLKRLSLAFLLTSLCLVPTQIIVSALSQAMEPKMAFSLYLLVIMILAPIFGLLLSFKSKTHKRTNTY